MDVAREKVICRVPRGGGKGKINEGSIDTTGVRVAGGLFCFVVGNLPKAGRSVCR